MKLSKVAFVLMIFAFSTLADANLVGLTPFGYENGEFVRKYENKSNDKEQAEAIVTFMHIFYANALAINNVKEKNTKTISGYYCESKAHKNPMPELGLFVNWLKFQIKENSSLSKKPITTTYPIYLQSNYPLAECPKGG